MGDYRLDSLDNQNYFSGTRVFISDFDYMIGSYDYYIFWNDGRCFNSDSRKTIDDIDLEDVLHNKSGTAGYYSLSDDNLCAETSAGGGYYYSYFKVYPDKLSCNRMEIRQAFRDRYRQTANFIATRYTEFYTSPGSDSVWFNGDSVAIWKPFW